MKKEVLLENLLGSVPKVKIIKLFIRNPERRFSFSETARLLRTKRTQLKGALKALLSIGFILVRRQSTQVAYAVNKAFPLYQELRALVLKANPASFDHMKQSFRRLGNVKLAVASGVFLGIEPSRVDLLLVGDRINASRLNRLIQSLEAGLGKEIVLVLLSTKEFFYRMNMYDKFLRDILEYRHEKLINKLKI